MEKVKTRKILVCIRALALTLVLVFSGSYIGGYFMARANHSLVHEGNVFSGKPSIGQRILLRDKALGEYYRPLMVVVECLWNTFFGENWSVRCVSFVVLVAVAISLFIAGNLCVRLFGLDEPQRTVPHPVRLLCR